MTLEGIAALAVALLLIVLVVQASFLVVARNAAGSAADTAARAASRRGADVGQIENTLDRVVRRTVPGAHDVVVEVDLDGNDALANVRFDWIPPGPMLMPVTIEVGTVVPVGDAP